MNEVYTPSRFLYIFPHPDDESFGPALAISRQRRDGHEVHLVTLTRGGATRQRHVLGLTEREMGDVRAKEMDCVKKVLDLTSFALHDLPDSRLKDQNPIGLESLVEEAIHRTRPNVIVTYGVHGVSGFADHLVTHAVVKRVFCAMQISKETPELRRLALFTLLPSDEPDPLFQLKTSSPDEIDALISVDQEDHAKARQSLSCYETYQSVIEQAKPLERVGSSVPFELFGESFDPPLASLEEKLPEAR